MSKVKLTAEQLIKKYNIQEDISTELNKVAQRSEHKVVTKKVAKIVERQPTAKGVLTSLQLWKKIVRDQGYIKSPPKGSKEYIAIRALYEKAKLTEEMNNSGLI
jgi:hypothetical protein